MPRIDTPRLALIPATPQTLRAELEPLGFEVRWVPMNAVGRAGHIVAEHRPAAGKARGRRLRDVPGDSTRPITDRAKESLFNILGNDIEEASLLDLFAGTGSVGIEALSRGASFVRFIDLQRKRDALAAGKADAFVDPAGCKSYYQASYSSFRGALARQQATAK